MAPKVSVGLPVYNGDRFLAQALDSLLAQDFADFEIIVSDNASTDGTEAICRDYAARDARVRYLRSPVNQGAAWNYNQVFELSRGEFFRWAAHDDLVEPSYLRRCLEAFAAGGADTVLCYPKTVLISAAGAKIRDYEDKLDLTSPDPCQRLRAFLARRELCNAVFGLHRRSALARTELIGSYFSSDVVLLVELLLQGQIHEVPEHLFLRRIHPGTSCQPGRTTEEIDAWFDPKNRARAHLPFVRLLREHLRAIGRSPLPIGKRLRCHRLVLAHWLARYGRIMAGECKNAVRRRLGLGRGRAALPEVFVKAPVTESERASEVDVPETAGRPS